MKYVIFISLLCQLLKEGEKTLDLVLHKKVHPVFSKDIYRIAIHQSVTINLLPPNDTILVGFKLFRAT